ncbi:unnamed protein product, partial [Mesorhabditis spiculigera]
MFPSSIRASSLAIRTPILRGFYKARLSTSGYRLSEKKGEEIETAKETPKPQYATAASFQRHQTQRRQEAAEVGGGQRPTAMQRRFLVLTRLYPSVESIPELVQHGTMDRMHDRMRVVFIVVGITGFFFFFLAAEQWNSRRINRDRDAGKVVTKMPTWRCVCDVGFAKLSLNGGDECIRADSCPPKLGKRDVKPPPSQGCSANSTWQQTDICDWCAVVNDHDPDVLTICTTDLRWDCLCDVGFAKMFRGANVCIPADMCPPP